MTVSAPLSFLSKNRLHQQPVFFYKLSLQQLPLGRICSS